MVNFRLIEAFDTDTFGNPVKWAKDGSKRFVIRDGGRYVAIHVRPDQFNNEPTDGTDLVIHLLAGKPE